MKTKRKPRWVRIAVAAVAGALGLCTLVGDASAIIGRPLTPLSFAGVARRTTRRAVMYGAVAHPYMW
jgi:hypothetical protein